MKKEFRNTRLARCKDDWATEEMIKQYIDSHHKHAAAFKKQMQRINGLMGSEAELALLYHAECGKIAPAPAAVRWEENSADREEFDDRTGNADNNDN